MSIYQLNFAGKDRVQVAIEYIQTFEPENGYYLAFSGGKDSVVIKALADMAGVKYDAHYNVTTVDPPELICFIREHHPDVDFQRSFYRDGTQKTMWNLIERRGVPTRLLRFCCKELKEHGGEGRTVILGVRAAESSRRAKQASVLKTYDGKKYITEDPDNPDIGHIHFCPTNKGKRMLSQIIDWSDSDVWEFININNLSYCKLYDEGYTRLGCIGCPMNIKSAEELDKYPKFKEAYIRAFERNLSYRKLRGLSKEKWNFNSGEEVMDWWLQR